MENVTLSHLKNKNKKRNKEKETKKPDLINTTNNAC